MYVLLDYVLQEAIEGHEESLAELAQTRMQS